MIKRKKEAFICDIKTKLTLLYDVSHPYAFSMPANVSNSIDALRRNFLWQGSEDKKKFHLVKWKELMVSKNTGGLGIRNLRKQNQSLMMKWLWKLANEDNMLW